MLIGKKPLLYLSLVLILLNGCSLKLIDDYDEELSKEIIRVAKEVDKFFIDIYDHNLSDRSYETFASRYRNIEAELTMLLLANRIRPLNEESIAIAENTLEQWQKLKGLHKKSSMLAAFPADDPEHISPDEVFTDVDIENNRKIFLDSFTAMANAEYAKKIATN